VTVAHSYATNAAEIGELFVQTIRSFSFTTTHEGKALGHLLADRTAEGIAERSAARQCDGDGNPWPLNSDKRRRMKYKRDGYCLTNYDTGQMLSVPSLKGKVIVEPHLVTIEYGTGEPSPAPTHQSGGLGGSPARQRIKITGGHATEAITDIDKATFAAEQGRGFFELDQDICDTNFKHFQEALGAHIANPGR
jgi:hypothetical protein